MKAHRQLTIVIKLGTQGIRVCQDHAADHSLCIGSSSIINEKTHQPILSILTLIVETAVKLHDDGHRVVIVSSGAIAVGLRRMDIEKKPKLLPRVQVRCMVIRPKIGSKLHFQALAAVGQCRLISLWDSLFNHLRQPVAQILLTRNDIADVRYINLR